MENLNTTFFSLRSINIDGQIRRSRFARSTVSSKTFERAQMPVASIRWRIAPQATEQHANGLNVPGVAGPVAQLVRAHP